MERIGEIGGADFLEGLRSRAGVRRRLRDDGSAAFRAIRLRRFIASSLQASCVPRQ
jgi:hypothetical protein